MRATGAPGPGGGDDEPEASPWGGGVPCVLCEALGGLPRGGATEGVRLVSVSRFLKFPILNPNFFFIFRTLGPMWRANLYKGPGWSMKGEGREQAGQSRPEGAAPLTGGSHSPVYGPPAPPPKPQASGGGSTPKPQAPSPGSQPGEDVRASLGTSPGVAIAALSTQFRPRRSCVVPYGLPEVLPLAAQAYPRPCRRLRPAAGEGGCNRGRGRRPRPRRLGSVGDWALPTTTT